MLGDAARARGETLGQLAGHGCGVHMHLTLRQPAEYPLHASANDSRTVVMPVGRRKVTPEGFATAVAAVRPDSVSCLADEVRRAATGPLQPALTFPRLPRAPPQVPPHAGKKRLEKSVVRTGRWLDAIVPALAGSGVDLFATVLGCGVRSAPSAGICARGAPPGAPIPRHPPIPERRCPP